MISDNFKIIIPATGEEVEKYYSLRYEILRKKWNQQEQSTRDEWEDQSFHALMLDQNNNAVATGRLQFISADTVQVRSMAVAEAYQRTGLGSHMLKFLEEEAGKRNFKKIVLDARDTALNFYLKNGYTVEGDSYTLFNVIPHFRMIKLIR